MNELIRYRGDYKNLLCYQKSEVVYILTYMFCQKFLKSGDRTIDQMIQAARSGKQNIIEGNAAATTSSKTEIHLMNVAKASLQELLEDYRDYIFTHGEQPWEMDSAEALAMRKLGQSNSDPQFFVKIASTRPGVTVANMAITLIHQADYLLYKHIENLERKFLEEGGFSEKMYNLRKKKK